MNSNNPIDKYLSPSYWNSTTPRLMPESFSTTEPLTDEFTEEESKEYLPEDKNEN